MVHRFPHVFFLSPQGHETISSPFLRTDEIVSIPFFFFLKMLKNRFYSAEYFAGSFALLLPSFSELSSSSGKP